MPKQTAEPLCQVAVIWIDWYPYHVARFRGLDSAPALHGAVKGIELVGGIGVHAGLKFRETLPEGLSVETLRPETSWAEASKLGLAWQLWKRLSQLQPKAVLVPGYYTLPGISAALWARLHRKISVLMTESTAGDHPRAWWKELPKRLTLRALFSWAVTGGKAHVDYLRQLGFPAERIVGNYDVVDNDTIRTGVSALREAPAAAAHPRGPYFLYVGRLAEEKNVVTLLDSWSRYREAGGRWPLVLCGDGPERGALQTLADQSGFGAEVHFAGLKSSRQLLPFYAHAGCFVLPSKREPWGLVVNEAMAAGLPVIVSQRCGCRADLVFEGQNGFSIDPFDPAALTRLLHAMERLPAEDRARLGAASKRIIAGYTPRGFGEAVAEIVRSSGGQRGTHLVTETAR